MPAATVSTDILARAFNAGADARLAGLPEQQNPYTRCAGEEHNARLAWYWREGWREVHFCYGRDARWPFVKLQPVEEALA